MRGDELDLEQIESYLEAWLATTRREDIFGGGALLTAVESARSR
jgi:hypothetical protein